MINKGIFTSEERERHLKSNDIQVDDHSKTLVKIVGWGTGLGVGYLMLREVYSFTISYFTKHPEVYDFCNDIKDSLDSLI